MVEQPGSKLTGCREIFCCWEPMPDEASKPESLTAKALASGPGAQPRSLAEAPSRCRVGAFGRTEFEGCGRAAGFSG